MRRHSIVIVAGLVALGSLLLVGLRENSLGAQEKGAASQARASKADADVLKKLESRINDLENRIRELEHRDPAVTGSVPLQFFPGPSAPGAPPNASPEQFLEAPWCYTILIGDRPATAAPRYAGERR